jgi:hypothetical protein
MGLLTLVSKHFKDTRPLAGKQHRTGTQGRADTDLRQDIDTAFVAMERTSDSIDSVGIGLTPAPTDLGALGGHHVATIAELLTGVIHADPDGASRNVTLPTAALAVAGVSGAAVGDGFYFSIINEANSDTEPLVVLEGGSTLVGNGVIPSSIPSILDATEPSGSGRFLARFTNVTAGAEAYNVYRLA